MEDTKLLYRAKVVLLSLFVCMLFLLCVKVMIQNEFATQGEELQHIEQQIEIVQKQNQGLEDQILQKESYQAILTQAKKQGFREAKDYFVIEGR